MSSNFSYETVIETSSGNFYFSIKIYEDNSGWVCIKDEDEENTICGADLNKNQIQNIRNFLNMRILNEQMQDV